MRNVSSIVLVWQQAIQQMAPEQINVKEMGSEQVGFGNLSLTKINALRNEFLHLILISYIIIGPRTIVPRDQWPINKWVMTNLAPNACSRSKQALNKCAGRSKHLDIEVWVINLILHTPTISSEYAVVNQFQ